MIPIGDFLQLSDIYSYASLEPWFLHSAGSAGWKVSIEDTFDSPHLMFYAEEGAMVPQGPSDSTRQSIWRGRTVGYLDYPRLRLLLPVKMEVSTYSKTNVGRFSLMGKEAKWVEDTSTQLTIEKYSVASVLQHLVVPRDIETLCPFVPQEIGGDGAFTSDHSFFRSVISAKSKDEAEVLFRMKSQIQGLWSHRFVASDKVRSGVQRQHLILPTLDRMRGLLPLRAVLVPASEEHRMLLDAVPRNLLETPMTTFTKVVKRLYYSHLFKGKVLPNLRVSSDVLSKRGGTPLSPLRAWFEEVPSGGSSEDRYSDYLSSWRRPGFRYYDKEPYFVVPYRHKDVMSVGWAFRIRPERATEISRLTIDDFIDVINRGKDIPLITQRLQYFFESDPLLEIRVRENASIRDTLQLVSWDKKLAERIVRFVRNNRNRRFVVYLVHPSVYFLGRIEEIPPGPLLVDHGSINTFDRSAATSNLIEVECNPIVSTVERKYTGVISFIVDGVHYNARPSRVSAIGPQEGLIEELRFLGHGHPDAPPMEDHWLPPYLEGA